VFERSRQRFQAARQQRARSLGAHGYNAHRRGGAIHGRQRGVVGNEGRHAVVDAPQAI
jgi:hypothetical protein